MTLPTPLTQADLTGGYTFQLGDSPGICGQRNILKDDVLNHLMLGLSSQQAPNRIRALFSLCGHAHQLASELCCGLQDEQSEELHQITQKKLHWMTVREHILRYAIDWPRLLPMLYSRYAKQELPDWSSCPIWHANFESGLEATTNWFNKAVEKNSAWLVLQREVEEIAKTISIPMTQNNLELTHLPLLCHSLENKVNFSLQPSLKINESEITLETGCWTRFASAQENHKNQEQAVNYRLGARWSELLHLLSNKERLVNNALQFGSQQLGAWRISYVEMSRGLLIHALKWQSCGTKIAQYRVIAPTEWNLHPKGNLAHYISQHSELNDRQKSILSLAFDPCVPIDWKQKESVYA